MAHIRRHPKFKGNWQVRYVDPSGRKQIENFTSKSDAEEFLHMIKTDSHRGEQFDPRLSGISLREWTDRWWESVSDLKPKTTEAYESLLRVHILPRFGDVALGRIEATDVYEWVAERHGRGVSTQRTRQAYNLLARILRSAVESGYLAETPCVGMSPPKKEPLEKPILPRDDVRVATEAAREPHEVLATSKPDLARDTRWLTTAWVVLLFVSSFRFSGFRDPALAAAGVASVENAIELLAYAGIAAFVAKRWFGRHIPTDSGGIRLLFALGVLAVASALWSRVPLFSLVRGSQVVVVALLTAYTAFVWNTRRESMWPQWTSIWTTFLWITCLVSGAGLLLSTWIDGRFAWPGTHPGVAAEYLGVAALVALAMLVQRWEVSRGLRRILPILVPALVFLMILTVTRSAIAAFVTALPFVIVTASFAPRGVRFLLGGFLGYVVVTVMLLWPESVLDFVLRDGSVDQLISLTGRTELWQYALEALERSPWFGFGYGSGRIVLTERIPWSGTGHNLWIESAVSLGAVGATLVTLIIGWLFVQAFKNRHDTTHPGKTLVPSVAVFLTVGSIAGVTIALPGFGLTVAALMLACVSAGNAKPISRVKELERALP